MRIRLASALDKLHASYWFLPLLMALSAIALSFLTIAIDRSVNTPLSQTIGFVWGGSPAGARSLLSTIAGSMITVAGVVFSITIVALQLASSQFGARILRNFMRDTVSQSVLGIFIATFLYSLLVLRTVRSGDANPFVPYLSVTLSILLAMASLGMLIYFVHHIAVSIQVSHVTSEIAQDLLASIDHLYPEELGQASAEAEQEGEPKLPSDFDSQSQPVPAPATGYVESLDEQGLLALAQQNDLILRLTSRPGHFVVKGDTMVTAYPAARAPKDLAQQAQAAFLVERERSATQDVEFEIQQLVEVAVRALSSFSDPFTAITCLDWLGAALSRLAEKDFPSRYRYDSEGKLRIIVESLPTFEGLVAAALDPFQQYAPSNTLIALRLLGVLREIAQRTRSPERRRVVLQRAAIVERDHRDGQGEPVDRQDVRAKYRRVLQAVAETEGDENGESRTNSSQEG